MMKKITYLLTGLFLFVAVSGAKAQADGGCNEKYNLFKGDVKTGKYDEAKPNLDYLLTSCPGLSINIYKFGSKMAVKLKDAALVKKLYEARLTNFPDIRPAKAHSDYATFLVKNKLASEVEVFQILEKAYSISPKDMSVKNIFRYFKAVAEKNKDTNPQKVFDTYDDVMESVEEKLEDYNKKVTKLQIKDSLGTLSSLEKRNLRAYTINSGSLGQVEGGLDNMISKIATCERLIPIYTRDFEANKTDGVWLSRAVNRMHNKGCQTDPLYEKLATAYADVTQSASAYNFVAGVLAKKGDKSGAIEMRKKAFDLETDPFKKAKYKLIEAQNASGARARSLAYQALKYNPNMGKAYLFIASLYQRSANSCGSDEFEKRMVYVAALNKALKAKKVDPGCGANRYIKSYKKNVPSKKLIFSKADFPSGSKYKIGCWIGETVTVP